MPDEVPSDVPVPELPVPPTSAAKYTVLASVGTALIGMSMVLVNAGQYAEGLATGALGCLMLFLYERL